MKVSEMKTAVNSEVKKDDYDACVIEYLQTPMMFDFFHKKVNKEKFINEEEWHCHTIYFQFVPLDFDFEKWKEVIKKTKPDEDFAYNLGKRINEKSFYFVGGGKRYIVGKIYERATIEEKYKDNVYFQNGIKFYNDFDKFAITERGSLNYIIPVYNEDESVHSTGKKDERYRKEQEEEKRKEKRSRKETKRRSKEK